MQLNLCLNEDKWFSSIINISILTKPCWIMYGFLKRRLSLILGLFYFHFYLPLLFSLVCVCVCVQRIFSQKSQMIFINNLLWLHDSWFLIPLSGASQLPLVPVEICECFRAQDFPFCNMAFFFFPSSNIAKLLARMSWFSFLSLNLPCCSLGRIRPKNILF